MTMYFTNRDEAGRQLAEIVFHPYGRSQSVILALGPGSLLVAKPISLRLQIPMFMVASKKIDLPGSFHEHIGAVDQIGDMVYNSDLTQGEVDDYVGEYHNYIDSERITAMHDINAMLGHQGFVGTGALKRKNILLVSDGLKSAADLDPVMAFLKPVEALRVVGLVPVASIEVIDRLHILTDEIRILSPKQNYVSTNHYYEENDIPDSQAMEEIFTSLGDNFLT